MLGVVKIPKWSYLGKASFGDQGGLPGSRIRGGDPGGGGSGGCGWKTTLYPRSLPRLAPVGSGAHETRMLVDETALHDTSPGGRRGTENNFIRNNTDLNSI